MDSDGEVEIVITGTYCLLSNMLYSYYFLFNVFIVADNGLKFGNVKMEN